MTGWWPFLVVSIRNERERERNRTQTQITDCIQITFIFALAKTWAQFDWFIHFSLNADRVSNIWQSLISNYLYIHRIQFDVGLKKVSSPREHFWYKQPNEWQKKRHHFHKILNYVGKKEQICAHSVLNELDNIKFIEKNGTQLEFVSIYL